MNPKLYYKGEILIEKDKYVDDLQFFNFGKAHLYGYYERDGVTMKFKVVTFKKGAWFGDYQIMLNTRSDWELEAGEDADRKSNKGFSIPRDHIMVY